MSENVKRRLVVRSNDDRRHSTTIFRENVAVTEISKQIIEVWSFAIGRSGEKENKNKNKTTTKKKKTVKLSGMNIDFKNTRKSI